MRSTRQIVFDSLADRQRRLVLNLRERRLLVSAPEFSAELAADLRQLKLAEYELETELAVLRRLAGRSTRESSASSNRDGECRLASAEGVETLLTGVQKLNAKASGSTVTFEGYAAVFNSASEDLGGFREYVRPGAFTDSIRRRDDVRLLINHEGLPLARTISGTLELREDSIGLLATAKLDASDPDVQRLVPKMQRRDLNQMSFGFKVVKDKWRHESGKDLRDLLALDLFDVSIVTFPAYPATSAGLRGKQPAVGSILWQAQREAEKQAQDRARRLRLLEI